jgi:hypothetical protein
LFFFKKALYYFQKVLDYFQKALDYFQKVFDYFQKVLDYFQKVLVYFQKALDHKIDIRKVGRIRQHRDDSSHFFYIYKRPLCHFRFDSVGQVYELLDTELLGALGE